MMSDLRTQIRVYTLRFLGALMAIVPLSFSLLKFFYYGPSLFKVKERPTPPKILQSERWGEHKYVRVDGVNIHYVQTGYDSEKRKPLMLFLHGFPEFWFSWRFQMQYFAKDFWCVAIDNRGYGDSDKPLDISDYSVKNLTDDVKAIVQAFGVENCVLVGHDWGGAIGYAAVTRFPELFKAYIVCNLPHYLSMRDQFKSSWEQRLKSWYMIFFQCPYIPEFILRLNDLEFLNVVSPSEEVREAYKYAFRKKATLTAALNYYRCSFQFPSRPTNPSEALVKVPVLSIFGTGDKYLSVSSAMGSRKYCKDFNEVYLDGVSHWVQTEAPHDVNKAMEEYINNRGLGQ